MSPRSNFHLRSASWVRDRVFLLAVREAVFVIEQSVSLELERDDFDPIAFHVLAQEENSGVPIGTGRLLPDGHIGRMCVLKQWRRQGVGSSLLTFLLEEARHRGHREVRLNAQEHAIAFYAGFQFQPEGELFEEAGIMHRSMYLLLPQSRI